ncbi:MAG: asparaginase [Cyanobacteria bacterium P01_D01_bin.73]
MNRPNANRTADITVRLLREGIAESQHQVQAVVCDERGRILMGAGAKDASSFIRSSFKPFQAVAVASSGTLERFSLDNRNLAIMCGSHQGTISHARQAFDVLWRCDIDASALQCPCPEGKKSRLQHNCSGKHAGMLALCRQQDWPLEDYMQRSHPLQQLIADQLGEFLGMSAKELIVARDDCGAPTYLMRLSQMAQLYAMLSSGDRLDMERIVRAMTSYPELISGDGGFDTELMRATQGEVVSKSGSEGVQCIGRVGHGLGLAIKVADGSKRAKYAAAIHILRQLGWVSPDAAESLGDRYINLSPFKRLDVVGELTMV